MVPVGTLCISQIEKKLLVFGGITGVHWIALCAAPAIFRMLLARNFLLCWLVGYGILLESSVTDLKLLDYGINVCLVVVHRHGYLFHTTLCKRKKHHQINGMPSATPPSPLGVPILLSGARPATGHLTLL
jgi:hypothetical protein